MAETEQTSPADAGTTTSEFKLTAIAMVVGVCLEAAAGVLHAIQDAGVAAPWIPAVLAIVGALIQVASLFGYQKSRTLVKVAVAASEAPLVSPPKS
jgi:hypothetical protein